MTISVVIPTYNGSRFVERAILSVLRQQRLPDEILVCDDNSRDDTLEICRRYKGHISILTNPEGPAGFVNAWNNAVAHAKGEFISILHQDDVLAPGFLRKAAAALEKNPNIRHLFCTCHYIDANDQILSSSYSPGDSVEERRYTGLEYVTAYQRQGHPHIHRCPGVITHKNIFRQCRYEPAAGHIADDDFFYRVGMYTDVIGILSPLASFRVHAGSVTGCMRDADLVRQLMDDYLYQCRQWKDHPFLDTDAYDYFVRNARKFARRYIGYGIKHCRPGVIIKGIKRYRDILLYPVSR